MAIVALDGGCWDGFSSPSVLPFSFSSSLFISAGVSESFLAGFSSVSLIVGSGAAVSTAMAVAIEALFSAAGVVAGRY